MVEMNLPVEVKKYVSKFASEKWKIELPDSKKRYQIIVVIPTLAEKDNVVKLLESILNNSNKYFDRLLICFVVNNTVAAPEPVKLENKETMQVIRELAGLVSVVNNQKLRSRIFDAGLQLSVVDACSEQFQFDIKNGGVGLARKTGMDLSLQYLDYSSPLRKLIVCLDADCTISDNYVEELVKFAEIENAHAGYVTFEHELTDDEKNSKAIVCYELFLRYYVLALQYAKSPFAIHTIGSTMLCDYEAYIKVQGMNKKKAAEDFYFMEKLAKHFPVHKIKSAKVYPSGRGSWRVPFGTGQRVNRFYEGTHDEYSLYSPESFKILKEWNKVFLNNEIKRAEEYLDQAYRIHPALSAFLKQNSFKEDWTKILNNTASEEQINRQKIIWFDAFKTLKLVHFLRDECFPNVNMFDAIDELFDLLKIVRVEDRDITELPGLQIQLKYLKQLRELA